MRDRTRDGVPSIVPALEEYPHALQQYLQHGGPARPLVAGEIGSAVLESGLGAVELVTAHQRALAVERQGQSAEELCARLDRAERFLAEALAPFETERRNLQAGTLSLLESKRELERRMQEMAGNYRAARDELNAARRQQALKDELVALISHELRTPLTSIHGALAILAERFGGEFSESARRLVDVAHRNSQRLTRLIDDILDLQKIEWGAVAFEVRALEVWSLLDQAVDMNQPYAAQLGVKLALQGMDGNLYLAGDPDRVLQVATNLLSNAARFSPPGETVLISAIRAGEYVRVSVADRGPGIPESFRDRVFQRFAQAEADTPRRRKGTGLGLSISKAIVESMHGRIGFDTVPGHGTTFYFDLPAASGTSIG